MQSTKSTSTASWLIPSIAAILAVLIAFWLPKAFSDKADVRFSLSSPISTKMLNTSEPSSIQEIAVKNIGLVAAKEVVLTCENGILGYEIYRSVETDKIQEYFKDGRLEVRYLDLRPSEDFKVVVKARIPLFGSSIGLKHSQGVGKDIFAKSNPFAGIFSGSVIFILYMFGWGWFMWKDNPLERNAKYNPKRILTSSKPWHLGKQKWNEFVSTAIDSYFSDHISRPSISKLSELYENRGYKYLKGDSELMELSSEQMEQAERAASKIFKSAVLEAMKFSSGKDEASKILDFIISFDKNEYSPIRITASSAWIDRMLSNFKYIRNISINEIIVCMIEKPDGVTPDHWEEYIKELERIIYNNIDYWIHTDNNFMSLPDDDLFITLSADLRQKIIKYIYNDKISKVTRAFHSEKDALEFLENYDLNWMNESDREKYVKNAENLVSVYKDKRTYEKLMAILSNLLKRGTFTVDYSEIPGDLVEPIRRLEADTTLAREEISIKAKELEETKVFVQEARIKVERQLEIIGIVLRGDQEAFSAIEYPEEIFGQINVERLREAFRRITSMQ